MSMAPTYDPETLGASVCAGVTRIFRPAPGVGGGHGQQAAGLGDGAFARIGAAFARALATRGEDVAGIVAEIYATPAPVVDRIRTILAASEK